VNQGFYLDLRLFLEGIQVPVIGASVTATIGSPASATIEIVPDDSLDLLLPRTVVHLFYLDHMAFRRSGREAPLDTHYKLLFCGELFGVSSNKAGMGSRSATLTCLDFSNVLDTNYLYQARIGGQDTESNTIVRDTSIFLGAQNLLFDNITNNPEEVIRRALTKSPSMPQHSGKQTLLGGLLAVLEILCGVQGLSYGLNQFVSVQERRVRFLESVVGDSGETASQVFQVKQFSEWLTKRLADRGQVMSFRQLTSIVFEYVFYEMVPNPCARYLPGNSTDSPGKPNRDIPKFSSLKQLIGELTEEQRAQYDEFLISDKVEFFIQAEFHEQLIPFLTALNSFAATGLSSPATVHLSSAFREPGTDDKAIAHEWGLAMDFVFSYKDDTESKGNPSKWGVGLPYEFHKPGTPIKDATTTGTWYKNLRRALFTLATTTRVDPSTLNLAAFETQVRFHLTGDKYPGGLTRFDLDIQIAKDYVLFYQQAETLAAAHNLAYLGAGKEKLFGGTTCPLLVEVMGLGWDPVHVQIKDFGVGKNNVTTTKASEIIGTGVSGSREALYTHIVRPDVWFCPPPKSNVIFPDMIQSFSTSRELIREASRLQLDVGFEFATSDSAILNRYFFAPELTGASLASALGERATSNLIFDHEKFSGIVPKFERMTDAIYFGLKNPVTDASTVEDRETFGTYASKVAHFRLLTSRYAARSASLSLSISPHIIPGFPALVIDSTMTSSEIAMEDALSSPTSSPRSFKLGMVQSVTHSISQGGAQTQVRLSQVRSHRTGDQSDDIFSELIGSDGTLTIQDAVITRVEASGNADLSIGGGITSNIASTATGDQAFFWYAVAATLGFQSFSDLIYGLTVTSDPQPSLSASVLTGDLGDRAVDQEARKELTLPEVEYQGGTVTSGTWENGNSEVLIIVKDFRSPAFFTLLGDVGDVEIQIKKYFPEPGMEFEFADYMDLVGYMVGNDLVIPAVLPGDRFVGVISERSRRSALLPVEEAIRPIWISDDYSANNITGKIYGPFFGTAAITDLVTNTRYSVRSVEEAVDVVALRYAKKSAAQVTGGITEDTLSYIYDFTRRPIANQLEVLASKSYFYDTTTRSFSAAPAPVGDAPKYYGGYHSNAVCFSSSAEYGGKLEYLDLKDIDLSSSLTSSGTPTFNLNGGEGDRMDPRLERADRVELYKRRIQGSVALSGASGIGKRG
jgi:hypothetical protein